MSAKQGPAASKTDGDIDIDIHILPAANMIGHVDARQMNKYGARAP